MKKIRLLLVGFGPRGKIWAKAIKKNSKTELVGICDINKDLKHQNTKKIIFFHKFLLEHIFFIKLISFIKYGDTKFKILKLLLFLIILFIAPGISFA